jgi:hypothetical protein
MEFGVFVTTTSAPDLESKAVCPPINRTLSQNGFKIVDNLESATYLLSFNHNPKVYKSFIKSGGESKNSILIRLEPRAVFPAQYSEVIESLYRYIFTPGNSDCNSDLLLPWPYYYNENPLAPKGQDVDLSAQLNKLASEGIFELVPWMNRKIEMSLIASNKVSPISRSNYGLRRKFASMTPVDSLQIYGDLWDNSLKNKIAHRLGVLRFAIESGQIPNIGSIYGNLFKKYPNAHGTIQNKHLVIQNSKFSLVIENDNEYVSEKLIDAIIGGSIPIYVGGNYQSFGIPDTAVVANIDSPEEVSNLIEQMSKEEIAFMLESAREWLFSDAFVKVWFGDIVFETIAKEISNFFKTVVD